ncbi:mandelate racemase/muconate lactonizing enzyme family protein [Brevibacterium sp. FAM 24638]|uniref:mandelate racemase/muconate lactonizing enzyme family protein n=1 Tax=Brevibacterium sp. FAM 24638 TaxID=3415681 RepID=UPI003C7A1865
MSRVVEVETWRAEVPLAYPIKFKWNTITHRDCVVVQISTVDGLTGSAIGLSRGAPLDVVIQDMLADQILGHDALAVEGFNSRSQEANAFLDQTGMLAQARALVDLALWDIRGKSFNAPLWKVLGGSRLRAPVLLVEGYAIQGESDEDFANRVLARVDQGYPAIKLEAAAYKDPNQLFERLRLIRDRQRNDVELVVDVNGSWHNLREARWMADRLVEFDIAWLEDPFPHHRTDLLRELTATANVPIGFGDDVTDPQVLMKLIEERAVDVLRVDATTLGGIQPTLDVIGAARQADIPVSGHAHPYVHQHFSFAFDEMQYVEAFPDDPAFEPSSKLTTGSVYPSVNQGWLARPEEPGLAFDLDLERIRGWATRHQTRGEQ